MHPLDSLTNEWADALFEAAPLPMAIVAPDHRFVRCNASYLELTGYSRGELVGRTWQSITHPDDLQGDQSGADAAQQDPKHPHYSIEKRYLTKRGEVVWVHLYVRGIWEAGKFQCYFVTAARQTLTRTNETQEIKTAKADGFTEWAQKNPKDAGLIVLALATFLGRDAVIDLAKSVFQK